MEHYGSRGETIMDIRETWHARGSDATNAKGGVMSDPKFYLHLQGEPQSPLHSEFEAADPDKFGEVIEASNAQVFDSKYLKVEDESKPVVVLVRRKRGALVSSVLRLEPPQNSENSGAVTAKPLLSSHAGCMITEDLSYLVGDEGYIKIRRESHIFYAYYNLQDLPSEDRQHTINAVKFQDILDFIAGSIEWGDLAQRAISAPI